jgi:hypothetical protein
MRPTGLRRKTIKPDDQRIVHDQRSIVDRDRIVAGYLQQRRISTRKRQSHGTTTFQFNEVVLVPGEDSTLSLVVIVLMIKTVAGTARRNR